MFSIRKTLFIVTVFAIAMGFLETAVVVYLRELYYAFGFTFPLSPMKNHILFVELGRELATIIMLAAIGYIAGRKFLSRFAWFLYSFAIWDLFYYIFLKLSLNWPDAITDWDILFLIPLPWVGPVWAPCVISLTMILLAYVLIHAEHRSVTPLVKRSEWMMFILASFIFVFSFTVDHIGIVADFLSLENAEQKADLLKTFYKFTPHYYQWWYFVLAEIVALVPIYRIYARHRRDPFAVLTPEEKIVF